MLLLGRGDEKNNYQVVIRLLNHGLNRRVGKPETGSDRNSWSLAECQRAIRELDRVARQVRQEIGGALTSGATGPYAAQSVR